MITYASAPGKVIWFGEHFVVLGYPAIASSINLRAHVSIRDNSRGIIIESRNLGLRYVYGESPPREMRQFKHIIDYCVEEGIIDRLRRFHAVIDSNIPVASGLGSSAATSVAFTTAFLAHHGIDYDKELISRIAYEAEKLVHGKPSGIDNTISTYGGFIVYRSGSVKRIRIKWPNDYILFVVDTGIRRNTGKAVSMVLERYRRNEDIMKHVYRASEKIVNKAIKCLRSQDMECIAELMNINHGLLVSIGVSLQKIELIIHRALENGALAAKITGAGLGGSVIVLLKRELMKRIMKALRPIASHIYVVKPVNSGIIVKRE